MTCSTSLSFFNRGTQCPSCISKAEQGQRDAAEANRRQLDAAYIQIANTGVVPAPVATLLARQPKTEAAALVTRLRGHFAAEGNMTKAQVAALMTVIQTANLSHEDVEYNTTIRPHQWMASINEDNRLPTVTLDIKGNSINPVLQKGETIHFANLALLREHRSRVVGWEGGSRGWSIPIGKTGFRYRVGSFRGQSIREEGFETTSRGLLLITNKRVFLTPMPGNKPLSIPLRDVVSYAAYDDAIEIYKKNRDKAYLLHLTDNAAELASITLGFLLSQHSEV